MGLFDWLIGGSVREDVGLDDVLLPDSAWEVHSRDEVSRAWFSEERVAVRLIRVPAAASTSLDVEEARQQYSAESGAHGGATIEVELVEAPAGRVLRSIHKYRSQKNPLAIHYVGVLLLSWPEVHFRLHTEALEKGTTGLREAAVMLKTKLEGESAPAQPPVAVESGEELMKLMGSSALRVLPSDEPRWDDVFPEHPLSRVRKRQRAILEAIDVRPRFARCGEVG